MIPCIKNIIIGWPKTDSYSYKVTKVNGDRFYLIGLNTNYEYKDFKISTSWESAGWQEDMVVKQYPINLNPYINAL